MQPAIILVIQIILGLILTGLIIMQSKGTGLARGFMGASQNFSTRRGFEKVIFNVTIVVAVLFFFSSVLQLII